MIRGETSEVHIRISIKKAIFKRMIRDKTIEFHIRTGIKKINVKK